jgi:hypothetical protein
MKDTKKTLKEIFNHLVVSHPELSLKAVEARRRYISQALNQKFEGVIRYGPFKGLKFSEESAWGHSDRARMLLGLYEQEVLTSLQTLPRKYRYFINIGAADGYYGIGVLVSNLFEKSWFYEVSQDAQKKIQKNCELNIVSHRVVLRGEACSKFEKDFSEDDAAASVLFVDIEGGEFELFRSEVFKKFKKSVIFIELHNFFFPDGKERLNRLRNDAEKYFKITTLTTTSRDLSVFEEIQSMSDSDRWLICSEGRPELMNWWRLDPI